MRIHHRLSFPRYVRGLACLFVLALWTSAHAQVDRSLKILYAGRPGSDREKDFVAFLQKHFNTVQTGDLKAFKEADAAGFDVTLLDWDWNDLRGPRPRFSEDLSKPIITLGVPGGLLCSSQRLKTGYL